MYLNYFKIKYQFLFWNSFIIFIYFDGNESNLIIISGCLISVNWSDILSNFKYSNFLFCSNPIINAFGINSTISGWLLSNINLFCENINS